MALILEEPKRGKAARKALNPPEVVDQLVRDNIRLASFLAHKRAFAAGLDYDDVLSRALDGLMRAAEMYDTSKGKFGTYASYHIKSRMSRDPLNRKSVKAGYMAHKVSLDAPMTSDPDSSTWADMIADERQVGGFGALLGSDNVAFVREWVAKLNERERFIIEGRFGLTGNAKMRLEELGKILKITRERVRQIEALALKKLGLIAKQADKIEETPEIPNRADELMEVIANPGGKIAKKPRSPRGTGPNAEANRKYYLAHKKEIDRRNKLWYQRKRTEILAKLKAWRKKHSTELSKRRKKFYEAHQEEAVAYSLRYYYDHLEELKIKAAAYRNRNRENIRAKSRRRSSDLTDSYVREQMSKHSTKSTWEWTAEEVAERKAIMEARRARRLTDHQVLEIQRRLRLGETPHQIKHSFKCSVSTIYNIKWGRYRIQQAMLANEP